MKPWSASLIILLMNTGCNALHVPQSEIALLEHASSELTTKRGISITSSMLSSKLKPYVEGQRAGRQFIATRNFFGISLKTSRVFGKYNAVGVAIGSAGFGLDYSHSFSHKMYLTISGNAEYNYLAIIQWPMRRRENSGFGLGLFYRTERHGITTETTQQGPVYLDIAERYRVSAVGLRLGYYSEDHRSRMQLRFSLGYSPELKGVVFIAGISATAIRRSLRK